MPQPEQPFVTIAGATTPVGDGSAGSAPMPVTGSFSPPALQNVNITEVDSVALTSPALPVDGSQASGAALTANPIIGGGRAATANPVAVADGQVVAAEFDKTGRAVVVIGAVRDNKADAQLTLTATTAETTLIAAAAATFNDLYGLIIENISGTVCEVLFRDTTGGAVRFAFEVPANDTRGFMLPSSDGYKQAAVNTNWTAQCGTSVTSIKISALYVKNI